jgi:hypothetical protein
MILGAICPNDLAGTKTVQINPQRTCGGRGLGSRQPINHDSPVRDAVSKAGYKYDIRNFSV